VARSRSTGWCIVNEYVGGGRSRGTVGVDRSAQASAAPGRLYRLTKRAIDLLVSVVGLVVISPLMIVIAILIKSDSSGPVLFVQERVGYDPRTGRLKRFGCYKFRSMVDGADPRLHQMHMAKLIAGQAAAPPPGVSLKLAADPRITRVGRFLRRASLDELPQLINVVKGEMSIVGPRPALPYEVEMYKDWHRQRLMAVPGLTGWWQVRGRNQVCFDEAVRMDIYYVEHQSLWLDLQVVLLTPVAVVSGRGAG